MKQMRFFLTGLLMMSAAVFAKANVAPNPDFYSGKWQFEFKGLPNGDGKLIFQLKNVEGNITGSLFTSDGNEMTKITSSRFEGDDLEVGFSAQGYDVTVTIKKVDEDHVKASLMNMFEGEGVRVKE
jgi:hypothetical protein